MTEKQCPGCQRVLDLERDFHVRRASPNHHQTYCKVCQRARVDRRLTEDKARVVTEQAQYNRRYRKNHPDRVRAKARDYYAEHRERICARNRVYYQNYYNEHPQALEKRRAYNREYKRRRRAEYLASLAQ